MSAPTAPATRCRPPRCWTRSPTTASTPCSAALAGTIGIQAFVGGSTAANVDLAAEIAVEHFAPHNRAADEHEPHVVDGKVGLVAVTQVAIDDTWSALRFRYRDEVAKLTRKGEQA